MSDRRFAFLERAVVMRPLAVALVSAMAAALFASGYLSRRERQIMSAAEPHRVAVAARDISPGETIDPAGVKILQVPRRFVQPGAVESAASAAGRRAVVPIRAGSQITSAAARLPHERQGASALLPSGMRAFSVSLPSSAAAGGLVRPGDHIDLIATFDLSSERDSRRTTLALVEGARVLAVGREVAGAPEGREREERGGIFSAAMNPGAGAGNVTLTLSVSPEDAQRIAFARESGILSASLRPFDEGREPSGVGPTTISNISEEAAGLAPVRSRFREYKGRG